MRGAARLTPAGSVARPALHTAALTTAARGSGRSSSATAARDALLNVDIGSGNGVVICQLEGRDGSVTTVGSFRLTGGYGHWGSPEPCRRPP